MHENNEKSFNWCRGKTVLHFWNETITSEPCHLLQLRVHQEETQYEQEAVVSDGDAPVWTTGLFYHTRSWRNETRAALPLSADPLYSPAENSGSASNPVRTSNRKLHLSFIHSLTEMHGFYEQELLLWWTNYLTHWDCDLLLSSDLTGPARMAKSKKLW